jgi:RNA polymerase subunit RPABC4/transcription elongation factor Spt4
MTEYDQQKFCAECGSVLSGQEKYCPNCGSGVNRSSTEAFCEGCGGMVARTHLKCPTCGNDPQIEYFNFFAMITCIGLTFLTIGLTVAAIIGLTYSFMPEIIIDILSIAGQLIPTGFILFIIGGSQVVRALWNNENPGLGQYLHPANYDFDFPIPDWWKRWACKNRSNPTNSIL